MDPCEIAYVELLPASVVEGIRDSNEGEKLAVARIIREYVESNTDVLGMSDVLNYMPSSVIDDMCDTYASRLIKEYVIPLRDLCRESNEEWGAFQTRRKCDGFKERLNNLLRRFGVTIVAAISEEAKGSLDVNQKYNLAMLIVRCAASLSESSVEEYLENMSEDFSRLFSSSM